jgi:mono/diheme cytochrome c family protein
MMPASMTRRRRVLTVGCILAAGLGAAACGSQDIDLPSQESASVKRGAVLFAERCSGCHTMSTAGAQGGATHVHDRELVDGPSFDERREDVDSVLYAIRNGGFSGAIMPENIVVGQDAQDVAQFLAKYAGGGSREGRDITPESQDASGGGGGSAGGGTAGGTTGGGGAGGGTETTTTGGETTPGATTGAETTPGSTTGAETTPGSTTGGGDDQQAAAQGKQIFTQNCAGCHTLSDAGASGRVGPNLDDAQPDAQAVQSKVEQGGGGMPPFRGVLQDEEIAAVSEYVSSVAGQ